MRVGLLSALVLWVLIATGVAQIVAFSVEQMVVMGLDTAPGLRSIVAALYGLSILVPAGAIWLFAKDLRSRNIFLAFVLAGGFALLLSPARLVEITAAHEIALLQAAGIALFLLLQRRGPALGTSWRGLWPALLAAALVGIPWVLWGALGSIADTLLNLIVGILFGLAASRVLRRIYTETSEAAAVSRSIFRNGFFSWLVLFVMSTALGAVGNQGLLSFSVPALGWALAGLYHREPVAGRRMDDNAGVLALLAGLAAFWPLALFDPDEITVAFNFGLTQLVQWANLSAAAGLVVGLVIGAALAAARQALSQIPPALGAAAALIAWLAVAGLYLLVGQPGLHGERLFVIMKDQADLSAVASIQPYQQRRQAVYDLLVEKAITSQAGIRLELDRLGVPYKSYYLQNALEVQGGPLLRWWLSRNPAVDRILDSPILRPLPAPVPVSSGSEVLPNDTLWNLKMIGADRVWADFRVTGRGIIIGQSDSGVQWDHPELADSYRGRDGEHDFDWYDPWNGGREPQDTGGHGTHTLAIAVGNRVGVAPDAEWIGCVNLARNLGSPAYYLDCLEFMLAPFPQGGDPQRDGRPDLGAHVLNNSWGCPPVEGCDPNALLPAVNALRAAGVFVVTSAGNDGEGGCGSVADPIALYDQVYSVGAVDQEMHLAFFSSVGPVEVDGSGRVKPDITAPGVMVLSAYPGGTYSAASGTSMAGPHVAGVVALMWSANPTLIGDIELTEQLLNETAVPYSGWLPECVTPGRPNNGAGYGIVNAYDAVRRALGE